MKISKLTNIIKGHMNEITNKEEVLYNKRINICKSCALYKVGKFGPVCNPNLFIEPKTKKVSDVYIDGYVQGCGCRLNAKTRLPDAQCPANFW